MTSSVVNPLLKALHHMIYSGLSPSSVKLLRWV